MVSSTEPESLSESSDEFGSEYDSRHSSPVFTPVVQGHAAGNAPEPLEAFVAPLGAHSLADSDEYESRSCSPMQGTSPPDLQWSSVARGVDERPCTAPAAPFATLQPFRSSLQVHRNEPLSPRRRRGCFEVSARRVGLQDEDATAFVRQRSTTNVCLPPLALDRLIIGRVSIEAKGRSRTSRMLPIADPPGSIACHSARVVLSHREGCRPCTSGADRTARARASVPTPSHNRPHTAPSVGTVPTTRECLAPVAHEEHGRSFQPLITCHTFEIAERASVTRGRIAPNRAAQGAKGCSAYSGAQANRGSKQKTGRPAFNPTLWSGGPRPTTVGVSRSLWLLPCRD
jgi:hypothetical protein